MTVRTVVVVRYIVPGSGGHTAEVGVYEDWDALRSHFPRETADLPVRRVGVDVFPAGIPSSPAEVVYGMDVSTGRVDAFYSACFPVVGWAEPGEEVLMLARVALVHGRR